MSSAPAPNSERGNNARPCSATELKSSWKNVTFTSLILPSRGSAPIPCQYPSGTPCRGYPSGRRSSTARRADEPCAGGKPSSLARDRDPFIGEHAARGRPGVGQQPELGIVRQLAVRHIGRFVVIDLIQKKGLGLDRIEAHIVTPASGLSLQADPRIADEGIAH